MTPASTVTALHGLLEQSRVLVERVQALTDGLEATSPPPIGFETFASVHGSPATPSNARYVSPRGMALVPSPGQDDHAHVAVEPNSGTPHPLYDLKIEDANLSTSRLVREVVNGINYEISADGYAHITSAVVSLYVLGCCFACFPPTLATSLSLSLSPNLFLSLPAVFL